MTQPTRGDVDDKQGVSLDYSTPTRSAVKRDVDTAAVAIVVGAAFALWVIVLGPGIYSLPFAVWVASPYLLVAAMAWHGGGGLLVRTILLIAVIGSAIFGTWMYDTVHRGAQGGIALVVVPFYQLGAVGCVCFFVFVGRRAYPHRRHR